jgi:hypothetical protein
MNTAADDGQDPHTTPLPGDSRSQRGAPRARVERATYCLGDRLGPGLTCHCTGQVWSGYSWMTVNDRCYPSVLARMWHAGAERSLALVAIALQIRSTGQVVQDRPVVSALWADVPDLSTRPRRRLAAWQQCWQQSCAYDRGLLLRSRLFFPVPVGLVSESVSLPGAEFHRLLRPDSIQARRVCQERSFRGSVVERW